jgi:hypothetical protein
VHGGPDFGDDIDTLHLDGKLCARLGLTVPQEWVRRVYVVLSVGAYHLHQPQRHGDSELSL